jgi:hypothetical protein
MNEGCGEISDAAPRPAARPALRAFAVHAARGARKPGVRAAVAVAPALVARCVAVPTGDTAARAWGRRAESFARRATVGVHATARRHARMRLIRQSGSAVAGGTGGTVGVHVAGVVVADVGRRSFVRGGRAAPVPSSRALRISPALRTLGWSVVTLGISLDAGRAARERRARPMRGRSGARLRVGPRVGARRASCARGKGGRWLGIRRAHRTARALGPVRRRRRCRRHARARVDEHAEHAGELQQVGHPQDTFVVPPTWVVHALKGATQK